MVEVCNKKQNRPLNLSMYGEIKKPAFLFECKNLLGNQMFMNFQNSFTMIMLNISLDQLSLRRFSRTLNT